jgi:hypothetical protein
MYLIASLTESEKMGGMAIGKHLALRASSLTRFYFTCWVAELIDVPRADYHFDFWEDFVTGSTYRGDVASELTAHIVLKVNKRVSIVSHDIPSYNASN